MARCSLLVVKILTIAGYCSANLLYRSEGDLNLGFVVKECVQNSALQRTLINTAIWTTDRLNNVKITSQLSLGLSVYSVCTVEDYFDAIFKLYKERDNHYLLGLITTEDFPEKVREFNHLLNLNHKTVPRFITTLIKATVKLLRTLNWVEKINVVAPNQFVLREFYKQTKRDWLCVKKYLIYEGVVNDGVDFDVSEPLVVLGQIADILSFLAHFNSSNNETNVILVPFDGAEISGAPDGSYIIEPPYSDRAQTFNKQQNFLPTPLLFEVANPIISFTSNVTSFIDDYCNETTHKLNCLRNGLRPSTGEQDVLGNEAILRILKIEPLGNEFVYNILKVDYVSAGKVEANESDVGYMKTMGTLNFIRVFTYNLGSDNLTVLEGFGDADRMNGSDCLKNFERCLLECENFKSFELTRFFSFHRFNGIGLRPEPWVYAFLALSGLGIVFCVSILAFILSRLCRKNVLEGNPILTILLLVVVFLMYCSIIPFALDGDKNTKYGIYLVRSLGVTLPYTFAFALLLSRTILLATVSREVGFMSHVAGSVQAFLSLFIFAVQLALSLQLTGDCEDIFKGNLLVYLLSYNVILLILLMLITPLITKSQRNYREGKYFTVSVVLLAITWSCWLPSYAVLNQEWKDPMLCIGLVATASILLGSIFIPRTYLMTLSAARERFTSALPSLATATSAMDIYRASTQPVYDCVNVAAINAASNIRAGQVHQQPQQPDYYSGPDAPEDDDDFEVTQCDTPPPDKVTRF